MCEIAVLDPERANLTIIQQVAYKFHEEQGDGLGVLAVKQNDDGFEYEKYCSIDPHWQTLYSFMKRHVDETWRFVVHGRYKTAGAVNREGCHPIEVDCGECDWSHVVHNGSVRKHRQKRGGLTTAGHDFNTEVDSEVIAHTVGELPESVEDHTRQTYDLKGNLNYLLFSEDGIFVRVSQKYSLTDDFVMTCSYSDFDAPKELGFQRRKSTEWMLVTPGEDGPEIETKDRTVWQGSGSSSSSSSSSSTSRSSHSSRQSGGRAYRHGSGMSAGPRQGAGQPWPSDEQDDVESPDEYTVTYKDYAEEFDHIIAINVAPGVLRIIEQNTGDEEFVFRDQQPRLYYWYSPEPTPDNIDRLEELAEARREGRQSSLEDYGNGEIEEVIEEEVTERVMDVALREIDDGATISEVGEIEDSVREAVRAGNQALEGAIN